MILHDIGVMETFWYIFFFTWNYWTVWLYISRMITDQKINFCLLCSFVKHKNVSRLVLKFCFTFQSMDSCVLCKEELRSEYVTVGQKGRQTGDS